MDLFRVCNTPNCGSIVDSDDTKVTTAGANITVTATCLENQHTQTWSSSSSVGEGHKRIFIVNILLAAYTLFCGLNISQVLELFKHLNILCFGRTFFFKMKSELLYPVVWMSWCYSQLMDTMILTVHLLNSIAEG